MKILVTGSSGFIGKFLLKKLLEDPNNEITGIDNHSTSEPNELEGKIEFLEMNLEDYLQTNLDTKFDQIYHLASPVGPVGVLKHIGTIGSEIIENLTRIAKMAESMGAKLMFISTSEVYGKNPVFDQPENLEKIVPAEYTVRLEYGVGKLLGEIILANMAKISDLKYNIIRPFNIIGQEQKAESGFVVPRFIESALKGEDLTVYGDGTQKRTFTDVRDIVDAMHMIMNSEHSGIIFNIGNPKNLITIGELARNIIYLIGRPDPNAPESKISFVDPTKLHGVFFAEAWNKIPNIDRVRSLIGWQPKYSLEETLEECIKCYEVRK